MNFIDWLIDMPEEFSFWVEDQIAVMSPVTIAVVIVVALAVLTGIWLSSFLLPRRMRNTSEILAELRKSIRDMSSMMWTKKSALNTRSNPLKSIRALPR